MNLDKQNIELLENSAIPEGVKVAIATALASSDAQSSASALEQSKLKLQARQAFWGTPFVAALAGLITLSATFAFDRITKRDETTNTITIEQIKEEIEANNAALAAQLAEQGKRTDAEIAASAEERKFQYEIVRAEFSDPKKTNLQRADVLLFLARAGILTKLDEQELKAMAAEQKENPESDVIPPLLAEQSPPKVRNPIATIDEAPWQVSLLRAETLNDDGFSNFASQFCGGALVAPDWVLTAAYCVHDMVKVIDPGAVVVGYGSTQLSESKRAKVAAIHVNSAPSYSNIGGLALLKLADPVQNLAPISMTSTRPAVGSKVRVSGWGMQDGQFTDGMTYADYEVMDSARCVGIPGYEGVSANEFCGSVADVNADGCNGFGGGLAILATEKIKRAVGILSWGSDVCGDPAKPTVFSDVASAQTWMAQTIAGP